MDFQLIFLVEAAASGDIEWRVKRSYTSVKVTVFCDYSLFGNACGFCVSSTSLQEIFGILQPTEFISSMLQVLSPVQAINTPIVGMR